MLLNGSGFDGPPWSDGIALGSVVCIILTGLVTSLWALQAGVSLALPDVLKTIFFNLFIFAIGVKIGPQFFAGLERDGWHVVLIGLIVAVLAPVLAYGLGWFFQWPEGTVAGMLAGSNNSSVTFARRRRRFNHRPSMHLREASCGRVRSPGWFLRGHDISWEGEAHVTTRCQRSSYFHEFDVATRKILTFA